MKYTLKIKPYGETEREQIIDDFDDYQWNLVFNLYEELFRKCKDTYRDTNFKSITSKNNIITIDFDRQKPLTEEENEEYIETFCGYNMENIIIFYDVKYFIKGETVLKK